MSFFKRLAILFYVTISMFLGCSLLLFSIGLLKLSDVVTVLHGIHMDGTLRLITMGIAVALLLINYVFYRFFSVNERRDKIIAFDNPSGRVSVSLIALEDLVKRSLIRMYEVRDVRPTIHASHKGLSVKIRLVLRAEVSIPEVTAKVQATVLKKIQQTIGLDEPIDVSIYVGKILPEQIKPQEHADTSGKDKGSEPNIPFQGYRA